MSTDWDNFWKWVPEKVGRIENQLKIWCILKSPLNLLHQPGSINEDVINAVTFFHVFPWLGS